jgi:adenosine deaminase CECR1
MTIHSWKQLAEWSLEYSCLEDYQVKRAKEIFNKRWLLWCKGVIKLKEDWKHEVEKRTNTR